MLNPYHLNVSKTFSGLNLECFFSKRYVKNTYISYSFDIFLLKLAYIRKKQHISKLHFQKYHFDILSWIASFQRKIKNYSDKILLQPSVLGFKTVSYATKLSKNKVKYVRNLKKKIRTALKLHIFIKGRDEKKR